MTRFVLNPNDGIDTLHADALEECNLDDSPDKRAVDPDTADRLMRGGLVRRCRHCNPEPTTSAGGPSYVIPPGDGPAT